MRGWLRAGVFEGGIVSAIEAGTPQGSPISPLLANIALHVLDQAWQASGQRLGVLVKYADDLVALCATREQAEEARELVAAVLDRSGCDCTPRRPGSRTSPGAPRGSTSSAFSIGCGSRGRPGRWYLQKWPSRRAMASIRGKIRDRTDRRYARLPLEYAVENVNHVGPWLGELLPLRKLRAEVLRRSTATSTNASRSSPAPSTDSKAETGSPASTTNGAPSSASIA